MNKAHRFPPLKSQEEIDSEYRQTVLDGALMFAAGVAIACVAMLALYQAWRFFA
jgi:hypothetical protein